MDISMPWCPAWTASGGPAWAEACGVPNTNRTATTMQAARSCPMLVRRIMRPSLCTTHLGGRQSRCRTVEKSAFASTPRASTFDSRSWQRDTRKFWGKLVLVVGAVASRVSGKTTAKNLYLSIPVECLRGLEDVQTGVGADKSKFCPGNRRFSRAWESVATE